MERPTKLIETLVTELSGQLGLSAERDVEVIRHRVEHEGLSFLTITLPAFCDAFERGIENGRVTRRDWGGSFRLSRRGCLPLFLEGFTTRVFDTDGRLLPKADVDAIFAIRQVSRFYKKVKLPCSPERELAAIGNFMQIEGELRSMDAALLSYDKELDDVSKILWSQSIFKDEIDPIEIICKHGPGATAEKKRSNERFEITSWYDRSEATFPSDLHAIPNYGFAEDLSGIRYLGVSEEQPVRVVFVPKTLKTPRVIAIEPSHVQYMQQGLMDYCVPKLENHPLTRMSIHFSDQSVNNDAARRASITRDYATLDLKDASDRVHLDLVKRIFKGSGLLEYLEDSRSLYALLPDGREVILSKFASMGSAMCFPVEAMVFYTLLQSIAHKITGIRPTPRSVQSLSRWILVYGDDLIVPTPWMDQVVSYLEAYGLRVNRSKSFAKSHFRESCGGDYYMGISVKPVYIRELPLDEMAHWTPNHFMSLASSSDQLYLVGLWKTAQCIRDWIESRLGVVPRAPSLREGLQFYSIAFTTDCRYKTSLQGYSQRRWVFSPQRIEDPITTLSAYLNKSLRQPMGNVIDIIMGRADDVVLDSMSSVKRGSFKPKRRWIPVR